MAIRIEDVNIVSGVVPVDLSSGDNDGDWINLHKYGSVMIVFFKGAGTAGQDPTLTLEQAKDVAGLDAKGLNFDTIHTVDLSLFSNVTRIEIENIIDSGGLAWDRFEFNVIPAPATLPLMGLVALARGRRRR